MPRSKPLAVRADLLERLAANAQRCARKGPFEPDMTYCDVLEVDARTLRALLRALGYREERGDDGRLLMVSPGRRKLARPRQRTKRRGQQHAKDPDSPFAVLARLKTARKSR